MKKLLVIMMAIVLVVSFAACTSQPAAPANEPAAPANEPAAPANEPAAPAEPEAPAEPVADTGVKVGFSNCTMDSPFYGVLCKTAADVAAANGIDLTYLDAGGDIEKQNNDISDLLNQGCDIIIINPVDPDAVSTGMDACEEAGVPVFTVDRFCDGTYVAHIGVDNNLMGQMEGETAVELLGGKGNAKGVVLEVMGATGCKVMKARSAGFHSVVDAEPGIEVVQTPYTEYTRSIAVECVTDILQTRKDFNLIYSHCDDCAVGSYNTFCDFGLDDVYVVSVDGLREYVELLADDSNNCYSTTSNDPIAIGNLLVDVIKEYIENGSVSKEFYDAGTELITKATAQQYLDKSDATFVGKLST